MIELYQFPRAFGLPNPIPFCMKVETYLKLTGLPYEVKDTDPRKAPLGKLPRRYLTLMIDGLRPV